MRLGGFAVFITETRSDHGNDHLILQVLIEVCTPNDLAVRMHSVGHDRGSRVDFFQANIGGSRDVQQHAACTVDRCIEQRAGDRLLGRLFRFVLAAGTANAHVRIAGVFHDLGHIGEVAVDKTGCIDKVRNALHALTKHIVCNVKSVKERNFVVGHILQVLVRDNHQRVGILGQFFNASLCLLHSVRAFKGKRCCNNTNRQDAEILRDFGNDRCCTGARAATHAGGNKHHFTTGQRVGDRLAALFGSACANLRLCTGAAAFRGLFADQNLVRSRRFHQGGLIRVDGNEFHIFNAAVDHAVHSVSAAAANTDNFDLYYFCIVCIDFISSHGSFSFCFSGWS